MCEKQEEDLCLECLKVLEYGEQICPECGEESAFGWTHEKCKKKGPMEGLIAIYAYQDEKVQKVISSIKFDFNQRLVPILVESLQFELGKKFDMVVPVPLFFYRENWRGFNQAELIGEWVAKGMDIECTKLLKRLRNTGQLSLFVEKNKRNEAVAGAFVAVEKLCEQARGKNVLLVDDVFTSGATMKECAKILKKVGVKTVWGLVLAH